MRESFYLIVLTSLLAGLSGCETSQTVSDVDTSWEQPRSSMVLNNRKMRQRTQVADSSPSQTKWYDSRNDETISTWAGYRNKIVTETVTRTYDQQRQTDGNVHDHYRSSTYRTQRTTVVR